MEMKFLISKLLLLVMLGGVVLEARAGRNEKNVYIVYMGAAPQHFPSAAKDMHSQLLASVLQRSEDHVRQAIVRSYQHGFSGFAAKLSATEAKKMERNSGVVSVFRDPILQLHTTRSWDFLQYQTEPETGFKGGSGSLSSTVGEDTIIGILDTGVWPESESFSDQGLGEIPTKWKGVCMSGFNFNSSNCNKKLIGARYYKDSTAVSSTRTHDQTPRDTLGHGTHTASTAAGAPVSEASYYGLALGIAKGGSPSSRIAAYRVCSSDGCRGSSILAAFDDAIADGVDVLSLSLGASATRMPDFSSDPIAIGAFHAVERGIVVVCSAGNDGPDESSVVNAAPWIITVAATTIDRDFESDIVLGNSKTIKGESINFSTLKKSPVYSLITAQSAKSTSGSDDDASNCNPNSMDGSKIDGKIVLCKNSDTSYSKKFKVEEIKRLGGVGMVLVDDVEKAVAFPYGGFPLSAVSSQAAADIFSYINSTRNPVGTILPTFTVNKYKPAPAVGYFSSRGPSSQTPNILKPDVAAPGVNILAAYVPKNDSFQVPTGQQKPSAFNLLSGTSMACPHVSGIAGRVKSKNPSFSPSAIKSAIMTTASLTNNEKAPLAQDSGQTATPYDYGAGEVNPPAALQPGLVYDTEKEDYLLFLCNYGYQVSKIKLISTVPEGFACPNASSEDLISNLNYPSIAIAKLDGKGTKTVNRTVTNVGQEVETTYTASVLSPTGLDVEVIPVKLQFTQNNKKLSYQVKFSTAAPTRSDHFGSITWTNEKYKVRIPFVVTSK